MNTLQSLLSFLNCLFSLDVFPEFMDITHLLLQIKFNKFPPSSGVDFSSDQFDPTFLGKLIN